MGRFLKPAAHFSRLGQRPHTSQPRAGLCRAFGLTDLGTRKVAGNSRGAVADSWERAPRRPGAATFLSPTFTPAQSATLLPCARGFGWALRALVCGSATGMSLLGGLADLFLHPRKGFYGGVASDFGKVGAFEETIVVIELE